MRKKLSFQELLELQRDIACHRHEPSYKTLFLYFHKPLLDLAASFLKSREPSEEIVCDVLMKVWTMKESLLKIKNLKFYLYQAVRNAAINELEKNKKYISAQIDDFETKPDTSLYNPEELFMKEELSHKIICAIKELPPKCQLVYKLVREEGFTYKEVGQLLNISTNTVDRHLNNALHKLLFTVKEHF